jgi:hypothetical protein
MPDLLPHRRRPSPGPSAPHEFVPPPDVRSALALGSTQPDTQIGPAIAVTAASVRDDHCALPGCGKSREDPIHQPPV